MLLVINAVNTASKYFQVIGDVTSVLAAGDYIQVQQSTGNNGIYKLASVTFSSGYTRLNTVEAIPSSAVDGVIAGGVYELSFSNSSLSGKAPLIIAPFGTNTTTSLKFNGKASLNFGQWQQTNILRLLENFASNTAPTNPTIGQVWYDSANDNLKRYTATGWSTDLNVDAGKLTFWDPSHATTNTKFILTGAEPTGLVSTGVTLYPAVNPANASSMFRITNAGGTPYFAVEYNGVTMSRNPLSVTSTTQSSFTGPATVNTSATGTVGLTVGKNIVVTGGDVVVDSGKAFKLATGGSVTLTTAVTLRGTDTTNSVTIQSTGGTTLARFADAAITLSANTTVPTLNATQGNITTLSVTGTGTINTISSTTLGVTDTSTLNTANVTTLNVTGNTTMAGISATTLNVTGTSTLNVANATTLNVLGIGTIATAEVTTLNVGGTGTIGTANITTGTVTTLTATNATVTGDATLANVSMSGTATVTQAPATSTAIANKGYVDGQINTREPTIATGDADRYYAGDKTWKQFPWSTLQTPAISAGVLTLDLSVPTGFRVTLDQNVTSVVFSNVPSDRTVAFTIEWVQDSVGGYTVDWPISLVSEKGVVRQPDLTPDSITIHSFVSTGGGAAIRMIRGTPTMQTFLLTVSGPSEALPTGADVDSFVIPHDFTITSIRGSLRQAQATGDSIAVDTLVNGVSILGAPLTFANTERTAVQTAVVNGELLSGTELVFSLAQGDGTALGLKLMITGYHM